MRECTKFSEKSHNRRNPAGKMRQTETTNVIGYGDVLSVTGYGLSF